MQTRLRTYPFSSQSLFPFNHGAGRVSNFVSCVAMLSVAWWVDGFNSLVSPCRWVCPSLQTAHDFQMRGNRKRRDELCFGARGREGQIHLLAFREKETDRQTDRQTQTDRQSETERETKRSTQSHKETNAIVRQNQVASSQFPFQSSRKLGKEDYVRAQCPELSALGTAEHWVRVSRRSPWSARGAWGTRESAAVTSRQIKGKGLAFPTGTEGMKDMVLST